MSARPSLVGPAACRPLTALVCALQLTACGNDPASSITTANPIGPSAVTVGASAAGALAPPPSLSAPQPFPSRDQTYAFRLELEQIYRTELGRGPVSNAFDVEGDAVWTHEYMRYRVYACGHLDAVQKVFDQIDRGVVAPVCSPISGSLVKFPPYEESVDFRRRLDAKYRDELRRSPSPTFVDAEGAIVWTQEYLRYRVFACDDDRARAAVRTRIRGGTPPPFCFITDTRREVLGHWSGIIAMPSVRPFTMDITSQHGGQYSGTYQDIVFGSVSLTWDGQDRVDFFVYFGDGSGTFHGRFTAPDRVQGSIKYDKIATPYDFDMTRQ